MPYYKSKPVIVHAQQWNGPGDHPAVRMRQIGHNTFESPCVQNIAGQWIRVNSGDYIIREPRAHDRYYPCDPATFEAKYDIVENQQADRIQPGLFDEGE